MKRGRFLLYAAGCFVLTLAVSNCKDDITGEGGSPSNIVFPADSVSYSRHMQPLFNQTCTFSGCHDAGQNQSPLKLTDYGSAVIAIPGIVVAGQPDQSTLALRIEGRAGARMPLNRNPLNSNQITGIRKWISEGARNN